MTLQLDLVEQATVRHDANGVSVTRHGLLREVGGPAADRQRSALYAQGMPRYGDIYPPIPSLRVVDIQLIPIDSLSWDVRVLYREPTETEKAHALPAGAVVDVQWFSTSATVDRFYDGAGERMWHFYSGFPTSVLVNAGIPREVRSSTRQVGVKAERADVQIPSVGARVIMTESTDPRLRLSFVGKVNGGWWSGSAPRRWLFAGLAGAKERDRWINTYEVLYREDSWQLESVVEFNGAPPSDATVGNGIRRFDVYPLANFGALGFEL